MKRLSNFSVLRADGTDVVSILVVANAIRVCAPINVGAREPLRAAALAVAVQIAAAMWRIHQASKYLGPTACRSTVRRPVLRRLAYLHHFEVRLWRATVGTDPIVRNILPPCARRNAVLWPAICLVIDESTGHALPFPHLSLVGKRNVSAPRGREGGIEGAEIRTPRKEYLTKLLGYWVPRQPTS